VPPLLTFDKELKNPITTMKNLIAAIAIILIPNVILAEEKEGEQPVEEVDQFRTWTEEATKRTIEAKILRRDDKDNTVTILLKSMKTVTLDISKLIEEDQEYAKGWSKAIAPRDQLTVRVVASGQSRGGKRVEVDVKASKSDVVVSGGCDAGCHSLKKTVKAGERGLFQIEVHDKYTFTVNDQNGKFIDQETALKKTGVTKSR